MRLQSETVHVFWRPNGPSIVQNPERDFSISKNALSPSNRRVSDFHFHGRLLLEMEKLWNDQLTVDSHLDGEIFERVAIYQRMYGLRSIPFITVTSFVAQLERVNYRPTLIIGRTVSDINPIPFFSISRECFSENGALEFIERCNLFPVSNINVSFVKEWRRTLSNKR